jgi:hypothetical protein
MTTPENNSAKPIETWKILAIVVAAGIVMYAAFSANPFWSTPGKKLTMEQQRQKASDELTNKYSNSGVRNDIMTKRSCRDWYVQISEGGKGVQTDSERNAAFKKIYDVARYSVDVDIADAATRQIAALLAGDVEAFSAAATDFGNACRAHGQ